MRTYTSREACEKLEICNAILLKTVGKKPGFKVSHGRRNANLIDAELADRKYRLTIQPKVKVKGREF